MSGTVVVNDHLAELESELEKLSTSVSEIHDAQEAASEAVSASKSMLSTLGQVSRHYQSLYTSNEELNLKIHSVLDTISQVDFPSRLDNLDNTVSAINIAVQSATTDTHDLSKKFEELEDRLSSIKHSLMVQRGIGAVVAVLVAGGLIVSLLPH